MAINEYNGVDKVYDHFGNLLPNVERSEGIRPAGEFRIAPWLPTANAQFDKKFEIYRILAAGKIVALTIDGWVVPAGLAIQIRSAVASDVILKYTNEDIERRVISLVTGELVNAADVATNSGNGYQKSVVETALRNRGILANNQTMNMYVSAPVGVAPYAYHQSHSHAVNKLKHLRSPKKLAYHNFNMQSQIAILCDYVLELPWVPETQTCIPGPIFGALSKEADYSNLWSLKATNLDVLPLAQDRQDLAYTFGSDDTELFVNRKKTLRGLKVSGDYMVDADASKVYFHHTSVTTADVALEATGVLYCVNHYNSVTDTGINSNNFACVVGQVRPGVYLKPTVNSNWIPVSDGGELFEPDTVGTAFDDQELQVALNNVAYAIREESYVIGQVLEVRHHPRGGLERVRTFGEHIDSGSAQMQDRMPGNATEGLPDSITYSGAANKTVSINIIRK